jgi:outer membrane biosynthesis protein TonB
MNKTVSIITSIVLSFALFFAYTNTGLVFAQNQSTTAGADNNKTSPPNQSSATVTGNAQTSTINKTSIPAEQTTVKVNKTTKPVEGQANLKPLDNQTMQSQVPSISGIQNKSIVQATGPATTEIVNKTTVPYNQTIIGTENNTKSQPQASNQTNQTGPSQTGQQQAGTASPVGGQDQKSQNQSKGPLDQLSSSVGNLLGGKK